MCVPKSSDAAAAVEEDPAGEGLTSKFVNLFPVWTVLAAGLALYQPSLFSWLTTEYFTAGLAMLMVSMGITLTPKVSLHPPRKGRH